MCGGRGFWALNSFASLPLIRPFAAAEARVTPVTSANPATAAVAAAVMPTWRKNFLRLVGACSGRLSCWS
jgi:hypothetical protein